MFYFPNEGHVTIFSKFRLVHVHTVCRHYSWKDKRSNSPETLLRRRRSKPSVYSYFEKGCRKKCARDNPERYYGIWSIHCSCSCRTYFFFLLSKAFLSTRKQMSMAFSAIPSHFFEEHGTQNHPQYLSGLSRAFFSTIFLEIAVHVFKMFNTCVAEPCEAEGKGPTDQKQTNKTTTRTTTLARKKNFGGLESAPQRTSRILGRELNHYTTESYTLLPCEQSLLRSS